MSPQTPEIPIRHKELFTKVRSLIVNDPEPFLRAGRALEWVWSYEAIKRREQALSDSLLYLDPSDPEDERLPRARARHERDIASQSQIPGLENAKVVETQVASRPFVCLYEFMQRYIQDSLRQDDPFDLCAPTCKRRVSHAKMILLVAWLAHDKSAHKRYTEITAADTTEFEADDYLGRSWLSFLVLEQDKEQRVAWTALVELALQVVEPTVSLTFSGSKQEQVQLLALLRMATIEVAGHPSIAIEVEATSMPSTESGDPGGESQQEKPRPAYALYEEESGVWSASFGGETKSIPRLKGMRIIQALLRSPGKPIAAIELSPPAQEMMAQSEQVPGKVDSRVKVLAAPPDSEDWVVDDQYRKDVARERKLLNRKVEEAKAAGDFPAVAGLEAQIQELAFLARKTMGLRGRPRAFASVAGRSRHRVGANIKKAIMAIAEVHPALGRHLLVSIQNPTGATPCYSPLTETSWSFAPWESGGS